MKKNFIYLLLLCSLIAQAQVTPSYPTIKLTKTVEGVKQDSLLVVGTDKTVKHIPYSKISSVQEYATASAIPVTGVAGKLYITKDNNKIYTWNGTFYSEFVGAKGDKGDQGIQGFKGDTGLTGADGAMGVQGPQGIQGIQGETGLRGIQGETGPQGPIGFTGEKGADGTGVSIKGSFDNTSQLPASGTDGDAYLISGNLHVWNGTAWVNVGNIQGPQGLIGLTGATGSQGIQGAKGEKGDQGIQGIQGLKGDTGAKGDTGSFNGDITADQVTETATRKFQTPTQSAYNDATGSIQGQLNDKPSKTGVGATGTWGINITGSSYNSTLWNGYDISVAPTDVAPSGIFGYYNSGVTFQRSSATALSSFLGLGSNAYTSTDYFKYETFSADANALPENRSAFTYALNAPHTGTLIHFGAVGYGTQINTNSSNGDSFSFRTSNGDISAWNPWRKVWHDGNFNPANYLPLSGGTLSGAISGTSATFSETVTASPATLPNHAVVKSQLDAAVGNSTSGDFPATVTNMVNVADFFINSATYTKIGNIVNAYVSISINPSASGKSTFNLPLPIARQQTSSLAIGSGSGSTYNNIIPIYISSNSTTTALVTLYSPPPTNISINIHFQYDITK